MCAIIAPVPPLPCVMQKRHCRHSPDCGKLRCQYRNHQRPRRSTHHYSNHLECVADRHGAYLYVDVGGGSTEINFLCDGILQSSASYNIGTLRLLTGKVRHDEWQRMQLDLETIARRVPHVNIIGSGGNINKIYRMASVKDTISKRLPIDALLRVYNDLKDLTTEQRIERFSLKEDRADVIVPAAEIFLRIANLVHAEFIHVPVIGLADGIIDELYEQTNRK